MTSRRARSTPRSGPCGRRARRPPGAWFRAGSGPLAECGRVGAMRLARFLAHSGVASRRAAERMIAGGRVTVGSETVTDPARDVDESVDVPRGGAAARREPREVWALNKPLGVVSTARDPGGRPIVTSLVRSRRRLYPVG